MAPDSATTSEPATHPGALRGSEAWILVVTLAALVFVNVPSLGSDPWAFRPSAVTPRGILGPFVRMAHRHWDVGALRSAAVLAGLGVMVLALSLLFRGRVRSSLAIVVTVASLVLFVAPGVVLQAGLRDATAPWFYDNDSTYQIELGGKLVRHGHDPYGYDYSRTGLARFYNLDGTVTTSKKQVALQHFAYFPGTALLAAAAGALPSPLDDYRFVVALATLGLLGAALAFPGPLGLRLAVGAALAGNPLAVRATWFGTADATALLLLMLSFCAVRRSRYASAGAALAGAILMKQFALVALPFLAVVLLAQAPRRDVMRCLAAFLGVLAVGTLPFAIADPGAFWSDTIAYGSGTYRIVGYGLASLLLRAKLISSSTGYYPFSLLALFVWIPISAALLWALRRDPRLVTAAAGFGVSMYVLLFLARVSQTSYLIWPLTAIGIAVLLATSAARPLAGGRWSDR